MVIIREVFLFHTLTTYSLLRVNLMKKESLEEGSPCYMIIIGNVII